MNSERRHELQQNDLAIYLNKINHSIEPYSKIIAVVVGAVIIGGLVTVFYSSHQVAQRSDSTLQLIEATASQDAEVLLGVSDEFPDTIAGAWARLYQGKQYLVQGIQALYTDREMAEQFLGDAQAAFKNAIASSDDKLLHSRGYFGIARAQESLGDVEGAIESYQEVISVNESEAMVEKAQDRIDTLSTRQSRDFLAWFSQQDFSPADPSLPPALLEGSGLSDGPDFKLPKLELPGLDLGSGGESKELSDGGIEMPAEGAEKSGGEGEAAAEGEAASGEAAAEGEQSAAEADAPSDDAADDGSDS